MNHYYWCKGIAYVVIPNLEPVNLVKHGQSCFINKHTSILTYFVQIIAPTPPSTEKSSFLSPTSTSQPTLSLEAAVFPQSPLNVPVNAGFTFQLEVLPAHKRHNKITGIFKVETVEEKAEHGAREWEELRRGVDQAHLAAKHARALKKDKPQTAN